MIEFTHMNTHSPVRVRSTPREDALDRVAKVREDYLKELQALRRKYLGEFLECVYLES